ncbi:MAG: hypothetical protein HKN79_12280 [Flavobacteriales bacterium]|nr:hypothetical protein [Flavobacteriales bacterium]
MIQFIQRHIKIFLVILIVKSILAGMIIHLSLCAQGIDQDGFYLTAGDTRSYFEPLEHLATQGKYFYLNLDGEKVIAGRTPFYGLLYFIGHSFLNKESILSLYVLLQVLLEAISVLLLWDLIRQIVQRKWIQWFGLLLLTVSTYHTFWSCKLIPESLALSCLIILFWLLSRARPRAIALGILLLILTGLKPYLGILAVVVSVLIIKREKSLSSRKTWRSLIALWAPLFLFVMVWGGRNYAITGKVIPFTEALSGYSFTEAELAFRKFMAAKGESQEYWDKKAESSFYYGRESVYTLDELYTDSYITSDTLLTIRQHLSQIARGEAVEEERDRKIAGIIERTTSHYKETHPSHLLTGSLDRVKDLIFHSGSYYLPIAKDSPCYSEWQWIFKLMQSLFYYLFTCFGLLSLFLIKDWRVQFMPWYLIALFCIVLQFIELRFFLLAYPSLVLGSFYLTGRLHRSLKPPSSPI